MRHLSERPYYEYWLNHVQAEEVRSVIGASEQLHTAAKKVFRSLVLPCDDHCFRQFWNIPYDPESYSPGLVQGIVAQRVAASHHLQRGWDRAFVAGVAEARGAFRCGAGASLS